MIRSIDAAADHEDSLRTTAERSTWVAIKLVRSGGCGPLDAYPSLPRQPYFQTRSRWFAFLGIWFDLDSLPPSHFPEAQRLEI
jgi:hypothetical protein